jgi:desulfoferrodoxin (superoxide reductase-like protein)
MKATLTQQIEQLEATVKVLSSVAQKITDQHDAAWISATANHNVVKAGKILSDPHLPDTGFIRTTEIITELRALHVVLKLNSESHIEQNITF